MFSPAGCYDRALARLSRRELLKMAWFLGVGAVARPAEARRVQATPFFNAYPFTLGVASGDPLPDGVVLWTRLAPQPLEGGGMPMVPVPVQWELARDAAFRTIAQKGEALARPELGHSVHVEVSGLEPAHDYWYRFRAGNEVSQIGRTRTAPRGGAAVDRLRFGVCGCSHYETGYFTALPPHRRRAVRLRLSHRGLHLRVARRRGQNRRARPPASRGRDLHAGRLPEPLCAVQVGSRSDGRAPIRAVHRQLGRSRGREQLRGRSRRERHAARPCSCCAAPPRIRRTTSTCRCGSREWPTGPAHADLPAAAVREPDRPERARHPAVALRSGVQRRRCGTARPRWIRREPCSARSRRSGCSTISPTRARAGPCVGQQVYSFARDFVNVDPDARFSMDVWDGYVGGAPSSVFAAQGDASAPNPIVLSGDVHDHFGADLKMDFTDPRSDDGRHRVHQHVDFRRPAMAPTSSANWEQVERANPHIRYHSARRGYIACTATPSTMRADFKILDKVTVRDAPIRIGGSLVVESGRAGSESCLAILGSGCRVQGARCRCARCRVPVRRFKIQGSRFSAPTGTLNPEPCTLHLEP